jgi:hypothetical protein
VLCPSARNATRWVASSTEVFEITPPRRWEAHGIPPDVKEHRKFWLLDPAERTASEAYVAEGFASSVGEPAARQPEIVQRISELDAHKVGANGSDMRQLKMLACHRRHEPAAWRGDVDTVDYRRHIGRAFSDETVLVSVSVELPDVDDA